MLFNYQTLEPTGKTAAGSIDAVSMDVAVASLQKRGLMIVSIEPAEKKSFLSQFTFGSGVSNKDIVILSKQMATLFDAQVSPLKIFTLLAAEVENEVLRKTLEEVVTDIQGGAPISKGLAKHPKIFSEFYVNMVRAGEETGKLNETFLYLAEHLDRNYEVVSKVKNALIYPAFVITVFFGVMILMFTVIVPKISSIIIESGQEVPFYTKIVFGISNFLLSYGFVFAGALIVLAYFLVRYLRTDEGKDAWARFKIELPYFGGLYQKLYLAEIADNMNTMIASGIPMVKALEITGSIVENDVYKGIIAQTLEEVRGGRSLSQSFSEHSEVPGILVQMIKVGEETGELGSIFKTMARFYQREVVNAVDTLVALIEPAMIVGLGLAVGILLVSVLIPIYNIAGSVGA
jgi:type IV pilus assembly protein PilC